MPKITTLYGCLICSKQYRSEQEAICCETRPPDPRLAEVGDIVTGQRIFGWFDGDETWVVDPRAKKGEMSFYYVVTHIDGDDQDPHRVRYHLFTKAMTGGQGYRSGWTYNTGHLTIRKPDKFPERLKVDSKDLIGQKAERLL